MSGGVDGRAAVGLAFGVASLLALGWVAAGFFFRPVGTILAISSLVSTDDPPISRRRAASEQRCR